MPFAARDRLRAPETRRIYPTAYPTDPVDGLRRGSGGAIALDGCSAPERSAGSRHPAMNRQRTAKNAPAARRDPRRLRSLLVSRAEAARLLGDMSLDLFDETVRPHLRVVTIGRRPMFVVADLEHFVERKAARPASHRRAA